MTEQLVIRNFGPIRGAHIEVKNLTVFVGPQATGKSMAAQLLYFMRGLEDLFVLPINTSLDGKHRRYGQDENIPTADTPLAAMIATLEWWFGNEMSFYVNPGTIVGWNPDASATQTYQEISWDKKGVNLSESLGKRLKEMSLFPQNRQVYIPAGRVLYSFLSPVSATRYFLSPNRARWPGYISVFYEALGSVIDHLWRNSGQQKLLDSFSFGELFAQQRIKAILKGEIRYGPDTVLLEIGQQLLRPETIASGQMEIWPFWVILEQQISAPSSRRIYFEEPEAHLHPGAQRNVMEIIAYLVNQGGQFVLTTHSPYILYAINNYLLARQVLDKGRDLPPDIPPEIALRADQVAAYRFSNDGQVHNIIDAEVGLIDEDELDQVADELGATFTRLQERLEDGE